MIILTLHVSVSGYVNMVRLPASREAYMYVAVPGRNRNIIPLRILIALLRLKCCSAVLHFG